MLAVVAKLQALYQVSVLLVLNFRGISILNLEGDTRASRKKNTVIFNAFVLCQVYVTFVLLDKIFSDMDRYPYLCLQDLLVIVSHFFPCLVSKHEIVKLEELIKWLFF